MPCINTTNKVYTMIDDDNVTAIKQQWSNFKYVAHWTYSTVKTITSNNRQIHIHLAATRQLLGLIK